MGADGRYARNARHALRGGLLLVCLSLAAVASSAAEATFKPSDDATVLERLPAASRLAELAPLRQAVQTHPERLRPALKLARAYIDLSRARADPRYLGYAEATLAPWPDGPAAVTVLRATVAQSRHEFEHALKLLDDVLAQEPGNGQARLTRAIIHQVRGRLDAAAADCRQLIGHTTTLVFMICYSNVESLSGELDSAYDKLAQALNDTHKPSATVAVWARTVLGEMAVRQGRTAAAARHYKKALEVAPDDIYLQAAYADLLLDRGDNAAVIRLLSERERQDVLLLRLALAGKGTPEGERWADMLADRFAAAARRGDTTHAREHARFVLDIQNNPDAALQLARDNWQIQKEPADSRILLRTARAAGQPAAAKPALDWMQAHDFQDKQTVPLAHSLREAMQ